MTSTALGAPERAVLLAFADDEHLMGQRHTEWIGVAPFLEEDLAFSSIAQDELGHAAMLYELVLESVAGDSATAAMSSDVDELAFRRAPEAYRSCWLAEAPCQAWADALVRHWLYDAAEQLRWEALAESAHPGLAGTAARALHEEQYHGRHADALLDAMRGDTIAEEKIRDALRALVPLALGLFEMPADAVGADQDITGPSLEDLAPRWRACVSERFDAVEWSSLEAPDQHGRTVRSEWFGEVYGRMREVLLLDQDATW
jgi:ring-1,2-phenylacetyl-CoA epoxidase subunit PaaC